MPAHVSRPQLARQISALIGPTATILDVGTGWPSQISVGTGSISRRIALHVSRVSPHARRPWEWRFQNPASGPPVSAAGGSLPLLVGLDDVDGRPVLVVADGRSRVDRLTRFSLLFNKRICISAAAEGWSEQVSSSGEHFYAMVPRLFPLDVDLIDAGVDVGTRAVAATAEAAGLLEDDGTEVAERARRTLATYVRDAKFSRDIRQAYEHRCAMCELGLGLVAGAHIMPVSAPGAPDKTWNGIALCHNHHAAFDAHKIWISREYKLEVHPAVLEEATANPASKRFLDQTCTSLILPNEVAKRPRTSMLEGRYDFYRDSYDWAPAF